MRNKHLKAQFLIVLCLISLINIQILPLGQHCLLNNKKDLKTINVLADQVIEEEWLSNNDFDSDRAWSFTKGTNGDSSDIDGDISNGQGNLKILGEERNFTAVLGAPNNTLTSPGWIKVRNGEFQLPDQSYTTDHGFYVTHDWNDDTNQAPSVHWRNNISMTLDMSDYIITSASLQVLINATVQNNIDTPNDQGADNPFWVNFAIGDSITFYAQITDVGYNQPIFTVAQNKTKYLGQNSPPILEMNDTIMEPSNELDLITALTSAFEKDPDHSNFTLILGIDIYSEDNDPQTDNDDFDDIYIKSCNLTFTYQKKIDKFTSISLNQIGDKITDDVEEDVEIEIENAILVYDYKIDTPWPTNLSPFSEIRTLINEEEFQETIRFSQIKTVFNEIESEEEEDGYEISDLIDEDEDIAISIEIYIANTFNLGENINISIDNVELLIKYRILDPVTNWTPLIIGLVIGMIALVTGFTLYEKHYKYPPMVRKIRKLKRKIKRGKGVKSLIVNNREELIRNSYKKKSDMGMVEEITQPKIENKLIKNSKA